MYRFDDDQGGWAVGKVHDCLADACDTVEVEDDEGSFDVPKNFSLLFIEADGCEEVCTGASCI